MSLRLPLSANVMRTLGIWATELRGAGVVTVGRNASGIPQWNERTSRHESVPLAELGDGWTEWTPTLVNPVVVSNVTFVHSRYQVVAKTFFSQGLVKFTVASGPLNFIELRPPLKLFTHPVRGILCGMTDERNLTTAANGFGAIGVNPSPTGEADTPIRLQTNVAAWATSDNIEIFWDMKAEVID